MFNKKTVFVLGAGASAEYRFPTGDDLKKQIANGLLFGVGAGASLVSGDKDLFRFLDRQHREGTRTGNYIQKGRDLSTSIMDFQSIDEALRWWTADQEIIELGKLAIAHYILKAEQSSVLGKLSHYTDQVENTWLSKNTWLSNFLSIAIAGLDRDSVREAFDNVTLINFNYDRSVEHYLHWALRKNLSVSEENTRDCLSRLRIIRPYGCIGKLEWQENSGVPFGSDESSHFAMHQNIRTFTEQIEDKSILQSIDQALSNATLVVFLGFGFHKQNLSLFEQPIPSPQTRVARVIATVYKVAPENHADLLGYLYTSLKLSPNIIFKDCKAGELLVEMRLAITMTVA